MKLPKIIAHTTLVQVETELKLRIASLTSQKTRVKLIPIVFSYSGKNQTPIRDVLTRKIRIKITKL